MNTEISPAPDDERFILVDEPASGVRRLALHLPAKKNALNPDLVADLMAEFQAALDDDAVRSIMITGANATFCSGGDLSSMGEITEASGQERMARNHQVVAMVRGASKPVVAAVEGWAMGGGAGLALLADTVIAGRSAKLGFPFFRVGLVPDYGLFHTLPRRVGWPRAKQMFMNCAIVTGENAEPMGLVDVVVDDAEVQARAIEVASQMAAMPQASFREVKKVFEDFPRSFEEDLAHEFRAQVERFQGPELTEGRAAFAEKRDPDFTKFN